MNILVFGLGKSGLGLLNYLSGRARLFVYDDKKIDIEKLRADYGDVSLYEEGIDYDLLALSPGPSPRHPLIGEFRARGVAVIGELGLALEEIQGDILAITGTNGKSTTTSLVKEMVGKKNPRTFIGGNIGVPLINYVESSKKDDCYVVEMSSFQLESLGSFVPKLSVVLNITPDHISWHGSMDKYIKAKMEIWRQGYESQLKIINADDELLIREAKKTYGSLDDFYFFSTKQVVDRGAYQLDGKLYLALEETEEILEVEDIKLKGKHNMANALAASLMARLYGVEIQAIREVLGSFSGLEHRYELLEEKQGRRFINDSKATNVESSLPALESAIRPTVLIAGGLDKEISLAPLFERWNPAIRQLIVFGETKNQLHELASGHVESHKVDNLDQAFELAMDLSQEGWDIVFSPACASWDMYENFEKRGEHFKELHRRLNAE